MKILWLSRNNMTQEQIEEKEFKFVHAGWERVVKIEVITERL